MALLEVCVDSIADLFAAEKGGASRIELCSRLDLGGLSPAREVLHEACERSDLPLCVMVRPWPGGFVLGAEDLAVMEAQIEALRHARVHSVVVGALTHDGLIDPAAVSRLTEAARPMRVTFHRAFDEVRDPFGALDELIQLGVDRVLTAGGQREAFDGRHRLRALVERAAGRIVVMAGGGVRRENVAAILEDSGVDEVHASVPFHLPGSRR